MKTDLNLKNTLLETARRRTIFADTEARLLGLPKPQVTRAIAALRKAGLIYRSDHDKAGYWGAVHAGYRANARHPLPISGTDE